MSKLKIKVNNKIFNLQVDDDDFRDFLKKDIEEKLGKDNNQIRDLVNAYVAKNEEIYRLYKKIMELNDKLN